MMAAIGDETSQMRSLRGRMDGPSCGAPSAGRTRLLAHSAWDSVAPYQPLSCGLAANHPPAEMSTIPRIARATPTNPTAGRRSPITNRARSIVTTG